MKDEEYIRQFAELYYSMVDQRRDSDYVINYVQMDKLMGIVDFFAKMTEQGNGEIEPVLLRPREEHGGVTATFRIFDIYGEQVKEFCDVLQHVSAFAIDATKHGVCLSVTVPDVFVPAEEE